MKKPILTAILLLVSILLIGQTSPFASKASVNKAIQNQRSLSLPFSEDWSSSSFETNNWTTDCGNWVINNNVGNDEPSAEFLWIPQKQNRYNCTLESDLINAEDFFVGQVMLQFEVKHEDQHLLDNEHLIVEVYDGAYWNRVAHFNDSDSLNWAFNYIDITEYALGKEFRIRFKALGSDPSHTLSWFIDNIEINRICEAPYYFDGWFIVDPPYLINKIEWKTPESAIRDTFQFIHWDDGVNVEGVGLIAGGDISVAARWDEDMLTDYDGDTLHSIRIFLADSGFSKAVAKIWTGEQANTLIFHDTLNDPFINQWNEVKTDTLLLLDSSLEYWVGYTIFDQDSGRMPLGVDIGPRVPGYGDMFSLDEELWVNTGSFYGWNWNIQIEVVNSDTASSELAGFNLYRWVWGVDDGYEYYDYIPFVNNQETNTYTDTVVDYRGPPDHCYQVNAVWLKDGDTCISQFGSSVIPFWDFICINYSGTNELLDKHFKVYPNPVFNKITIKSEFQIEEVLMLDIQGQTLYHKKLNNSSQHEIDVSYLQPSFYFVQVKTDKGLGVKKFIKIE